MVLLYMVTWIPSMYPSHVSIYIPAPWILWVLGFIKRVLSLFNSLSVGSRRTTTRGIQLGFQWMAMLNGENWLSIINITLEGLPLGVLSGHITMEKKNYPCVDHLQGRPTKSIATQPKNGTLLFKPPRFPPGKSLRFFKSSRLGFDGKIAHEWMIFEHWVP